MRKVVLFVLALLAGQGPGEAEVTVSITASPINPVPNLLRNAGFEGGKEMPFGWVFWASEPWLFVVKRESSGGRSGGYFRIDENVSTVMSAGMMGQEVKVQPETTYRVGVWTRLRGGCATIYVSRGDGRTDRLATRLSWRNNDLQPEFIAEEDTESPGPDEWFWLGGELKTDPKEDHLTVQLATFGERSSLDYDDAYMGPVSTDLVVEVKGGPLRSVVIENETGEVLWKSDPVPTGTPVVRHTVEKYSSAARLKVRAMGADQKEVIKWYPQD